MDPVLWLPISYQGEYPHLSCRLPPWQSQSRIKSVLLIIYLALTWALVGLIWIVEGVHYPFLNNVGPEGFVV